MSTTPLINTPGYYYSIAYYIGTLIVISTNKKHTKGVRCYLVHAAAGLVLITFMGITDGIKQTLFIPSMAVTVSILMGYISLSCACTIPQAGYYCARAFINGEFAASLVWQLYYFAVLNSLLGNESYWEWLFLAAAYFMIFSLLFCLERYLQKNRPPLEIGRRELATAAMITIAVFTMSNISYIYKNSPFSSQFTAEMFIIRTLVDLSGMAVLYAYHIQIGDIQAKFEVNALQNVLEMQYRNYQLSQESIDIVNQKYHDLKHQITLLKMNTGNEQGLKYLEAIEQEIKAYEAQNVTGNKVLDAVLTSKGLYCQNRGIVLTCVAEGEALGFMNDMDISALFGNMLDNAIESAEKLNDQDKRLVHLAVSRKKGFLRIQMENYCGETVKFEDGMPVTTKKDKRIHGYGLKSIQSTVKKYGGSVTVSVKQNWFELRILIPIP